MGFVGEPHEDGDQSLAVENQDPVFVVRPGAHLDRLRVQHHEFPCFAEAACCWSCVLLKLPNRLVVHHPNGKNPLAD